MKHILFAILIVFLTVVLTKHSALASENQSVPQESVPQMGIVLISDTLVADHTELLSNTAYLSELKEVQHLRDAKNLNGLVKLADAAQLTWGAQTDLSAYFSIMVDITSAMSSNDFGYDAIKRQNAFAAKYVLTTLSKGPVPVDTTVHLLPNLTPELNSLRVEGKLTGQQWAAFRMQYTSLWLQTLDLVNGKITPNYDFQKPTMYDIVANKRRNDQLLLRQITHMYEPYAEQVISSFYSQQPYNSEELSALLDKYHAGSDLQASIKSQIPSP